MSSTSKKMKHVLIIGISAIAVSGANANPTGFSTATPSDVELIGDSLEFRSDGGIANFDDFSIDEGETFSVMPGVGCDSSCRGIARVLGGNRSELNGQLDLGLNFFLLNPNGALLGQNFKVNLNAVSSGFVVTTHALNEEEFSNSGSLLFNSSDSAEGITVEGLEFIGDGGQVLLLSDAVDVNGNVLVPEGAFSALVADGVTVSFDNNNLLQFDVTSAISNGSINVASGAVVNAGEINLSAITDDPLALAVNNDGVLRASGIDTSGGIVRLVGVGGTVDNDGAVDVTNGQTASGQVTLSGVTVELDGEINAGENGQIDVEIGVGSNEQEGGNVIGRLSVGQNTQLTAANMSVAGNGAVNIITGLANYVVDGENSGSAAFRNVGQSDWLNADAIRFTNVSVMFGRPTLEQEFTITETGSLGVDFQGQRVGEIHGGALNDTFIVNGSVESLFGVGGNDTFQIGATGQVNTELSGGADIDSLIDVIDPVSSGLGSGSGNNVALWTSIENVTPFVPPVLPPEPPIEPPTEPPVTPTEPESNVSQPINDLIAPQLSFSNLNASSNATLGLIGSGEPRLPCGYNTFLPSSDVRPDFEEDCVEENPEFQTLRNSIIYFDNDSASITLASAERLNRVSDFVIDTDLIRRVRIEGHTDDNASEAYNMSLSERRAASTSAYLEGRGVDPELIQEQHYGEGLPAVPNDSESNRALNRRAVINLEID